MALAPGTRLGAYEILSLLGRGGMGEVYRAKDTKLGRDVALKTLPDAFTNEPERLARFRREAQVLASLCSGSVSKWAVCSVTDHSDRSTNTGSVRDARRAGIAVAINVIAATTIVAVARTIGSVARMP